MHWTRGMERIRNLARLIICVAQVLAVATGGTWVAAQEVQYGYDDAGRLRSATQADGSVQQYTLDAAGNRTQTQGVRGAGRIQFTVATASVSESAGTLNLEVSRTLASTGAVSVSYATASGSATSGTDFTAKSGTLSWADGDASSRTISVPITNDNIFEGNEAFTVTLSGLSAGAVLGTAQVTGTIVDDDVVSFSVAGLSVNEAAGSATVTVTKNNGSVFTHNVSYASSNGSATAGSDYTAVSGTLTFSPAQSTQTFTVPIINDSTYEGNEAFTITLSAPTGGAVLGTASATITILESVAPPLFTVYPNDVNENSGSVTLTVIKSGPTSLTHSVSFATSNDSAVAGADYVATSGVLTFAPGETSKPVTIQLLDDAQYEGTETFYFSLSNPTGGATLGPANVAPVRIFDNEPVPSGGSVSFTTVTAGVAENAGSLTLTVRRNSGSYGAASVVCQTADGSAVAGGDYSAVSTTLTWANGDTGDRTCTIPLLDDSTFENSEYFVVRLVSPSGVSLGEWTQVTVVISENDPTPPTGTIQFSDPYGYYTSENAGSFSIPVTRTGGSYGAASAVCTTQSSAATAGADFGATSVTISWGNGDASTKYCTVPIYEDGVRETDCSTGWCYDEWFDVVLSNPVGAPLGDATITSVTIVDND